MTTGPRPLIVVEGPTGSAAADVRRLATSGYRLTAGFERSGPAGPRSVRHGRVLTSAQGRAALRAALDGHGLVVEVPARSPLVDRLVDDLRRLGVVEHRIAPDAVREPLDPETHALLALLAEGLTLGQAATELGLSRRTADRRLAAARAALGAERTTEAVARATRAGWLSARRSPGG